MRSLTLLLFALSLLHGASLQAALPAEVDGQPLPSLAPMLQKVMPAVVNVNSQTRVRVRNPLADDPFYRYFFGLPAMPRERVQQSLGSGVVVDAARGLVLTNNHVVEGADDISVTLADGRTLAGELLGADPDTDVALLRVPAENLAALPLADSSRLLVGDFVVAVGNPFGLGQTVTSGIVSALGRSGLRGLGYQNFIQTDASINPGNSGGALVNLRGELVGINTAIFSPSGGNVGIGFAIPANLAQDVMRQLLEHGEVRRGSLGVDTQEATPELAELLKLTQRRGAVVTRVRPDSPAARAGLQPGDVIVAIDGQAIESPQALQNLEGLLPVDKPLRLELLREGRRQTQNLRLEARARSVAGDSLDPRLAGARLAELDRREREAGLRGVRIAEVREGSRAAVNGLRPGDVVREVNRRGVGDLEALGAALGQRPRQLLLTVQRGRNAFLVVAE
jgi:serine protease DegQ